MADMAYPYEPREPIHPGESVLEHLEAQNWSQNELARRTGLTPKTISEICNGKTPISTATALAFEKVLQRPAHFWLNLQRQYDELTARQRAREESSSWSQWAARFPLAEMKKRWKYQPLPGQSEVDAVLRFLGVSSPENWSSVWKAAQVSYRQTRKFKTSIEAVAAWSRAAEIFANGIQTAPFDERRFRESLDELRHLTMKRASDIMPPVQAVCAAAGVAVVWVPQLPHTGISGCARWLSPSKALIALSLRYKTDDQMWFTFFHEVGHILLHRRSLAFVLDNAAESLTDNIVDPEMQQREEEANRFARDTIIPPEELSEFIRLDNFGNEAVFNFSQKLGIGPGLVVGRLQHDGLLKRHQGNAFKQKLNLGVDEDG
jgi:HTH-type transcriptional regulator / antitoxin HigA